jgi:hypothetical protein
MEASARAWATTRPRSPGNLGLRAYAALITNADKGAVRRIL